MPWVDIVILLVIGISAVISLFRGFVREVMSIAVWVVAFWVAFLLTGPVAALLDPLISVPSVRHIAAFLMLLFGVLIAGGLLTWLIGRLVASTGMGGTDRAFGMLFGALRGVVIVGILVILARATPVVEDPWWRSSILLPHFDALASVAVSLLPPAVGKYFGAAPEGG